IQRRQWDMFLDEVAADAPWRSDPRYEILATVTAKGHADDLDADLLSSIGHRTRAELWEIARRVRAPFHPVNRINDIVDSDHFAVRGFFVHIEDGHGELVTVPGAPYRMWRTPWGLRRPAPRLGQHNAEILGDELGIPFEDLVAMARAE